MLYIRNSNIFVFLKNSLIKNFENFMIENQYDINQFT